ncbi:unnamed protein product [[Candida] boidinii]|nr:unnamed protein product [[Candida] boidinii]
MTRKETAGRNVGRQPATGTQESWAPQAPDHRPRAGAVPWKPWGCAYPREASRTHAESECPSTSSRSTRAGEARGSAARGGSPAARGGGAATDGHRIQDNSILRAMEIGHC